MAEDNKNADEILENMNLVDFDNTKKKKKKKKKKAADKEAAGTLYFPSLFSNTLFSKFRTLVDL